MSTLTIDRAGNATAPARADDAALVARIVAGERGAFAVLMRRHNQRLFRLARAVLRDDAEAEDALQDAYVHAYRALGRFRGGSSLATWLARVVMNECLGRLRRRTRRQEVLPMVDGETAFDPDAVANDAEQPDEVLMHCEMRQLLERRIDALPDALRVVFVLRAVEEASVDETARTLGLAAATVRIRYFRARALLREGLDRVLDEAGREAFHFAGERCDRIVAAVLQRLDGPR